MVQKLSRGYSVVFGPDPSRDYSKGELGRILKLGENFDFIDVRFFGDTEHRSKRLIIPEGNVRSRDVEKIIQTITDSGLYTNLHLSKEILPFLENPDKLGYGFLENFEFIVGHREEMELFMPSLEDWVLSTSMQSNKENYLTAAGEKTVLKRELLDKLLIENTFEKISVSETKKLSTTYLNTGFLAINRYDIRSVLDIGHLIRGLNPNRKTRLDVVNNYVGYGRNGNMELTTDAFKICQNTPHLHVHGTRWSKSENRYYDHFPLRKPEMSRTIPWQHRQVLYELLDNCKIRRFTVEQRKKYHTKSNLTTTADNFEELLEKIKNGDV